MNGEELSSPRDWGFSTRALHVGQGPDPATGAVVQPIHMATTFAQQGVGKHKGFEYSRTGNPTRNALEECLAALEDAKHCLAFSSGLGAETTLMLQLNPGDHVVYMEDVYGGTFRLFDKVLKRFGMTFTAVDAGDIDRVESAMTEKTRMVWLESPTNPLLRVVDIDAVSEVAHSRGAIVCVDNTFATPYLQQPLHLGADVVVHSSTKYIGGHSDVVGGAMMTSNDELEKQLRFHQNAVGAVPSPFDCWLLLRGVKTLALRVERQSANALEIATALARHKAVKRVFYPGLDAHPNHSVAARQMRVVTHLAIDERRIFAQQLVRLVSMTDPQLVLALLQPSQRGAPAVDLQPQPVFVPGADLSDRQAAFRAAVEAQQNRREVFALDGHRLAPGLAAARERLGRCRRLHLGRRTCRRLSALFGVRLSQLL